MPLLARLRLPFPAGRLGILRATIGAMIGLGVTGLVSALWLGDQSGLPILIGPMGASAVLLFAVPASPLAQPWSIIGGCVLSALVGIACAMLIPQPIIAAAAAGGLAILTMSLARCLHPPGGAVALTAVLGGPVVQDAGWHFALMPVALNAALLLACAWAFNNATRQRYPHRVAKQPANTHGTSDAPPQDRAGYSIADLDAVLARYDELIDVSAEDLDALFRQVEVRAHRRLHGAIHVGTIMSRDVIAALYSETVGDVRARMLARHLFSMPVVDDGRHVVGLITLPDLQGQESLPINAIMHRQPLLATDDQLIDALLPALSGGLHHEAIVVDAEHRLIGMLTQTDLLAALWRGHVAEQVSLAQGGTSASVPAKATAPV